LQGFVATVLPSLVIPKSQGIFRSSAISRLPPLGVLKTAGTLVFVSPAPCITHFQELAAGDLNVTDFPPVLPMTEYLYECPGWRGRF